MSKKTRFQRVSFERMIALAALLISTVFLLAFGGQILEIYRLRNTLASANNYVEKLRDQRAALEATRTYVQSDDYAEQVARAELNKIRPGDHRSVVITRPAPVATPVPTPTPAPVSLSSSYLDSWWELLFGS